MATKRDYYEVLGIPKDASKEQIKKAYRDLAKKYHPDVSTEANAEEKFKEVQEAYEVLSDDEKRRKYDQFGHADPNQFGGSGFGGANFSDFGFEDIFSSVFGGFGGSRRANNGPQKGRDMRIDVTIDFLDACFGVKKQVRFDRMEACPHCHGTGAESESDIVTCSRCRGTGRVTEVRNTLFGQMQTQSVCPNCGGIGKQINHKCHECNGSKFKRNEVHPTINIPAGIDNDQTIRLAGLSDAGANGGPNGDLYVHVTVRPHEIFKRQGNDIYLELPLTFSQAALGCKIEVRTIHGLVNLTVPAGTQNDTKFKLSGKGVRNLKTGTMGNQIVIAKVITPTKLTAEQKELFNRLSNTDESASQSIFDRIKNFFKSGK